MPSSASRGCRSSRVDRVVQHKSQHNHQEPKNPRSANQPSRKQPDKHRQIPRSTNLPNPHQKSISQHQTPSTGDQRLWPLSPSLERIIAFFPIGSLWLDRLNKDESARLRFFRKLHRSYNHPLMRLSPANKHRALIISNYITELEFDIHNNPQTRKQKSRGGQQTQLTPDQEPKRKNDRHGNRSHDQQDSQIKRTSRNKSRKGKNARNLTQRNLALLEEGQDDQEDQEDQGDQDGQDDQEDQAEPTLLAKEVPVPASSKETKLYTKRQHSKAFKEEKKEEFEKKRQSQVEVEAGQLRMMAIG